MLFSSPLKSCDYCCSQNFLFGRIVFIHVFWYFKLHMHTHTHSVSICFSISHFFSGIRIASTWSLGLWSIIRSYFRSLRNLHHGNSSKIQESKHGESVSVSGWEVGSVSSCLPKQIASCQAEPQYQKFFLSFMCRMESPTLATGFQQSLAPFPVFTPNTFSLCCSTEVRLLAASDCFQIQNPTGHQVQF